MRTIAVTGTNGKTTTVELARQLLVAAGHRPASLGTLGLQMKGMSTYEPVLIGDDALPELVEELTNCYQADALLFEAFSASIMGKLYDKLPVDIAVLTYIGEDHIEYHGSKESYVHSKLRLFREILDEKGVAIYNIADERANQMKDIIEQRNINSFTFGLNHKSDLCLTNVETHSFKSEALLLYQNREYSISVPIIGDIFLLNWLAALSISLQFNVQIESLLETSKSLKLPPGRLEFIGSCNGAKIYVDYAHTACALTAVLKEMRKMTRGRLHLLFGCGGGRDSAKRNKMGMVALKYADNIYITDDNPRDEDPKTIRNQIKVFCPIGVEIDNRKLAIEQAIQKLELGDTLIVAGKGHENYQEVKGNKVSFSDKETVIQCIDKITSKHCNYELQLS